MLSLILIVLIIGGIFYAKNKKSADETTSGEAFFVNDVILENNIAFFRALNTKQKRQFETDVKEFLQNVKITGVHTQVENLDRILVAASAVIPVFAFPGWRYINLDEVLLYDDTFNMSFKTEGGDRNILGMVGTGFMEGKMILSKPALEKGFKNETDKNNTAIHEFVHLIDKMDGDTDGIPKLLLEKQYTIPWIDMLYKKMQQISKGESDINPYAITNKAEFFAVVSEYFFERPDLLEQKHPQLYQLLEQIFKQDPEVALQNEKAKTGRNDVCYCGSGLKYKDCCWRKDQELTA